MKIFRDHIEPSYDGYPELTSLEKTLIESRNAALNALRKAKLSPHTASLVKGELRSACSAAIRHVHNERNERVRACAVIKSPRAEMKIVGAE